MTPRQGLMPLVTKIRKLYNYCLKMLISETSWWIFTVVIEINIGLIWPVHVKTGNIPNIYFIVVNDISANNSLYACIWQYICVVMAKSFLQYIWMVEIWYAFYHDVGEIFWPQPIRSLQLGHVTGQGSLSPTWVGRVSDPGKNGFHKKCKNLDNITI